MLFLKDVKADVLVVGSGAAGLRAAIEARKFGVDIILVSKTPVGWANNSLYSSGVLTVPQAGLTTQQYFELILRTGKRMNNQKLVKILAEEAATQLLELREYGVELNVRGGRYHTTGPNIMQGAGLVQPLVKFAKAIGVKMLDNFMVFDLVADEAVRGAVGFNVKSGKNILLKAKAIVLASGGACQIYRRTDNPARTTGDGYVLAHKLGVPLIDMEFIQFFPIGLVEPGCPMFMFPVPPFIIEHGVLQNRLHEDIAKKHGLNPEFIYLTDRDFWSIAIAKEIDQGLGEGEAVLLNLPDIWRVLGEHRIPQFLLRLSGSFPLREKALHVSPLAHTFMGGVRIGENCQTNLPGLYVAGESAGGVRGANRVGGSTLTECIVFGARAGFNAAKYAKNATEPSLEKPLVKEELRILDRVRRSTHLGVEPSLVKQRIKEVMWKYCGIIRTERGLEACVRALQDLEAEEVERLHADTPRELMEALEAINMLTVAKLVATSAKMRKESRGTHYRSDYPQQNDREWLKNIIITRRNDEVGIELSPVPTTGISAGE